MTLSSIWIIEFFSQRVILFQVSTWFHLKTGSALTIAKQMMSKNGGRISVFSTNRINKGLGKLDERKSASNDSNELLNAATDFYKTLAIEANQHHVSQYIHKSKKFILCRWRLIYFWWVINFKISLLWLLRLVIVPVKYSDIQVFIKNRYKVSNSVFRTSRGAKSRWSWAFETWFTAISHEKNRLWGSYASQGNAGNFNSHIFWKLFCSIYRSRQFGLH